MGGLTDNPWALRRRLREVVVREEIAAISDVLWRTGGHRKATAELLQISYRSLLYKIKLYGLEGYGRKTEVSGNEQTGI